MDEFLSLMTSNIPSKIENQRFNILIDAVLDSVPTSIPCVTTPPINGDY